MLHMEFDNTISLTDEEVTSQIYGIYLDQAKAEPEG